jgi:hypothetical protein
MGEQVTEGDYGELRRQGQGEKAVRNEKCKVRSRGRAALRGGGFGLIFASERKE